MNLFDTHTHLNADQFNGKEAEYVQNAKEHHVNYMTVVGFDQPTIEKTIQLIERFPNINAAIGWHPTEASGFDDAALNLLTSYLTHPKVHILGEIGLDYYWDTATKSEQDRAFRQQIDLAKTYQLPITIHNRDATEDVYRVLKEEGLPARGCIMHSFGEGPEWAEKFIELGCHLSFSGVVTFKKTHDVRESAKLVPDKRLLIETDAPYLSPEPYRGKQNQPAYVYYVAEKLAEVRDVPLEELATMTTENAFQLYQWQPEESGDDR